MRQKEVKTLNQLIQSPSQSEKERLPLRSRIVNALAHAVLVAFNVNVKFDSNAGAAGEETIDSTYPSAISWNPDGPLKSVLPPTDLVVTIETSEPLAHREARTLAQIIGRVFNGALGLVAAPIADPPDWHPLFFRAHYALKTSERSEKTVLAVVICEGSFMSFGFFARK
jgi:hypothetical protein